jgi:protease I
MEDEMLEERLDRRVAILVEDGFEQIEMTGPRKALDKAGASTAIVSPRPDTVRGWNHDKPADGFRVDVRLEDANPDDFDALLLPGGVQNPDKLRVNERAVAFVKAFADAGKPIAAICHGPWTLIETGFVRGKTMTSWPSLKTDLRNAGATWKDETVVADATLVTSRKPTIFRTLTKQCCASLLPKGARRRFDAAAAGAHR